MVQSISTLAARISSSLKQLLKATTRSAGPNALLGHPYDLGCPGVDGLRCAGPLGSINPGRCAALSLVERADHDGWRRRHLPQHCGGQSRYRRRRRQSFKALRRVRTPLSNPTDAGTTPRPTRHRSSDLTVRAMDYSLGQRPSRLLPMQRALGLVDHLFDLVLCVIDLLLGLARATIGPTFGFELLVANEASDSLLGVTLHLIRLCAHRAPLFRRETRHLGWICRDHACHCEPALWVLARVEGPDSTLLLRKAVDRH